MTHEPQRELLSAVPGDVGAALRLLSAFSDNDIAGGRQVVEEIVAGQRVMFVMNALMTLVCRLGDVLAVRVGGYDAQGWIQAEALGVMDQVDRWLNEGGNV